MVHDMVTNTFWETNTATTDEVGNVEKLNLDVKKFYEMLDTANQPIYTGSRECLSKLSEAARMMNIKTGCMYWVVLRVFVRRQCVYSLGFPSEMIDVCIHNCMIYWK